MSSACLYPMLLEESVRTLLDSGVKTLEVFVNADSELEEPFVRELRSMADGYGARIESVHPFSSAFEPICFFSGYQRRYDESLRFYRRFFRAAELLGSRLFVFHGCFTRMKITGVDEYCERLKPLMAVADEYGVAFAQENVNAYCCASPDFVRAVRARLPELHFVLDVKQCFRAGVPVPEMADAMGEKILHVHLSDSLPEKDCLPPGRGSFDFKALFQLLDSEHPDCETGVIELYRDNYESVRDLQTSLLYLQNLSSSERR